ncbi:MAG: imidazoleglycerol-phosphate dehydratase HisB [Nitrospirae bacterium]|nr:MAG: imidazoleglycerol-phosphate dehydratase HisB [Nitrospirota bacterium]
MGRRARVERATAETRVAVELELDGRGDYRVATGIPFFDHMLAQLARHGLFDLTVEAEGDLAVDLHHTVEDTGLVLGRALAEALGDRAGIERYGAAVIPFDETLTEVAVDLSGRPYLVYRLAYPATPIGGFDPALVKEFLHAFAVEAGANLHVNGRYGENGHHIVESCFKGLARALRQAVTLDPRRAGALPTTKGHLGRG